MLNVRDMLRRLFEDGWVIVRQRGSHRQLRHLRKSGTLTVAGHPADTIPRGTYRQILRKAGLRDDR
jgi:predicted RNA binding protein YcfA (HicA-like mRNA interferase family)